MRKPFKASIILAITIIAFAVIAIGGLLLDVFIGGVYNLDSYVTGFNSLLNDLITFNWTPNIIALIVDVGLYLVFAITVFVVALIKKHARGTLIAVLYFFLAIISIPTAITDNFVLSSGKPVLGENITYYTMIYLLGTVIVLLLSIVLLIVEFIALATYQKETPVEEVALPTETKVEPKEETNYTPVEENKEPEVASETPKEETKIKKTKATSTKTKKASTAKTSTKVEDKKEEPEKAPKKKTSEKEVVHYFISKHRQTNKWQFKKEGSTKAIRLFTRKDEAIKFARQYIKDSPAGGELTIHG